MTKEELDILKQLSIIGKRIKALPQIYEDPGSELTSEIFLHVNALERIVFARDGQRAYMKIAAGTIIEKLEDDLKQHSRIDFTPLLSIPKKKQTAKKKKSPGRPPKKSTKSKTVAPKNGIRKPIDVERTAPKKHWRKPFSKPSS